MLKAEHLCDRASVVAKNHYHRSLSMGSGLEKRRFTREPLSTPIWIIRDGRKLVVRAQTDNLSFGGAHLILEDDSLMSVGDDVRIRMVLLLSLMCSGSGRRVAPVPTVGWRLGVRAWSTHA